MVILPSKLCHCYTYYIARAATERWYPQPMPDPPYEWSRGINSKLLNTASLVHFLSYFLHAAFAFKIGSQVANFQRKDWSKNVA